MLVFKAGEMSQRTPHLASFLNNADVNEHGLKEDNHIIWGFVIYRCTYASDSDWSEFLSRLQYHMEERLRFYNGLGLLSSFRLTVFEDKASLDEASKDVVREKFKEWSKTAPQQEQDGAAARINPSRYNFCIHVDEASLDSVLHDAPAPPEQDTFSEGYVNLIWANWEPGEDDLDDRPFEGDDNRQANAMEEVEDEAEEEEKEGLEPKDGCTEEDVGWMKVEYFAVMIIFYYRLRPQSSWYDEYRRPPEMANSTIKCRTADDE